METREEGEGMKKSQVRYEHVKRRRRARPRLAGIAAVTKGATIVRTCRVCGCTDRDCRTCVLRTGAPCSWVAKDLCSACVSA